MIMYVSLGQNKKENVRNKQTIGYNAFRMQDVTLNILQCY